MISIMASCGRCLNPNPLRTGFLILLTCGWGAYVAIAIEALIKAGNRTDEAKLFIQAREYSPLFALATKKADNLWTAGLGWRYRFRQNRIKNDVAQKVFEAGHEHLKTLSSSSDFTKVARLSLSMAMHIVLGRPFRGKANCPRINPRLLIPKFSVRIESKCAGIDRARDSDAPLWIKKNCARFQPSPTAS